MRHNQVFSIQFRRWQRSGAEGEEVAVEAVAAVEGELQLQTPLRLLNHRLSSPDTEVQNTLTSLQGPGWGAACTIGGAVPLSSVRSRRLVHGSLSTPQSLKNEVSTSSANLTTVIIHIS